MIQILSRAELDSPVDIRSNSRFIDISYHSKTGTSYLSPYFPFGNIPIPFSGNRVAQSVMSIWEGLKVFKSRDIDLNIFSIKDKERLRQSKLEFSDFIGYQRGLNYDYIYDEQEAYRQIFIPAYRWILEYNVPNIIHWLRANLYKKIVIIEDSNEIIPNQLSPGALLRSYVIGDDPFGDVIQKEIKHHSYCGKRVISWQTTEIKFKHIPPEISNTTEGYIEFDY